ncbi:MAG TPA: hypothetical protein VF525_08010 [Pyrinomonadaceae bacterium]|jgi:hypothetical protein
MSNLILPELATIKLKTLISQGKYKPGLEQDYRLPNIVFSVDTHARRKNDYHLGPFFSDENGLVTITRELLDIYVEATLESGLMDYTHISDCYSLIEIRLWSDNDLERAIRGRRTWGLLKREKNLWKSPEELIERFRNANNRNLLIAEGFSHIRDEWDGSKQEFAYDFYVTPK